MLDSDSKFYALDPRICSLPGSYPVGKTCRSPDSEDRSGQGWDGGAQRGVEPRGSF